MNNSQKATYSIQIISKLPQNYKTDKKVHAVLKP